MDRDVLDTSTIIKSIFNPPKSLSREIYKRELETHKKCRVLIKTEEKEINDGGYLYRYGGFAEFHD